MTDDFDYLEKDFDENSGSIDDNDLDRILENSNTVKKKGESEDSAAYRHFFSESSWMLSYGNLMTILMIFFMILYAYSALGSSTQYEKAMASLQKEMGGDDEQLKKLKQKEQETELASQMEGYIKDKNLNKYAKVETTAQKIKISLASPVLFDSGASVLKKDAVLALKEIAGFLKTMNNSVVVEGHTDNIPFVGKAYRSNFELSASRAFSVIMYFIEEQNFEPHRFSAFGYGEYAPIYDNSTRDGRAMNRRIEINIIR